LIAFANTTTRSESGEVYEGALAHSKIDAVKLLNMQIAIRNTTPISEKQGNWAAFFRLVKTKDMVKYDKTYTYKSICEIPGAKCATARKDLVLNFPRFPPYRLCGSEIILEDMIGNLFALKI